MPATSYVVPNGYVVAIEEKGAVEYYALSLDVIKNTLKLPPIQRTSFVKASGEPLSDASTYACDLWIDNTVNPTKFWNSQGEEDWRDLLIEEVR